MRETLRALGRALDAFEDFAVVALFCVAVALYFSQVVTRYLIGFTLAWAEESIVAMVVWASFIGASMAVRHKAHISVDLLVRRLPPALARAAALVSLGLCLLFTFLIFWWGMEFVGFMASMGKRAESMDVPAYLFYMAVPMGGALMTIRLLQEVWKVVQPGWAPEHGHHHAPKVEEGSI